MKMLNENWLLNVAKEGLGLTMRDEDKAETLNLIKKFIHEHRIDKDEYTINDDLSVSVDVDIKIYTSDVVDGHLPFKFKKVTEDFWSFNNDKLTSLEGCPEEVTGEFYCYTNKNLTSLKGCPNVVGGGFCCSMNKLESLDGCPQTVGGYFYCNGNKLESLEGCPQVVNGDFSCADNQLESLEGCPQVVNGDFSCADNQLESLEGCPQEVKGGFYCFGNKKQFTEDEVRQHCKVCGEIKVIKDENA